jgi:hypothetical protein
VIRASIAAGVVLSAWGCASSEQVRDAGTGQEYRISCSYFGWHICYDRADQICPGRYKVIAENEGLHGRELRISCPS